MITSKIIQTARGGLDEVAREFDGLSDEAWASVGIGPRALRRFADSFPDQPDVAVKAFGIGVISATLSTAIGFDLVSEDEAIAILSTDENNEPYPESGKEDIQDLLQMAFGIQSDDDTSTEDLMDRLINEVLLEDPEVLAKMSSDVPDEDAPALSS